MYINFRKGGGKGYSMYLQGSTFKVVPSRRHEERRGGEYRPGGMASRGGVARRGGEECGGGA